MKPVEVPTVALARGGAGRVAGGPRAVPSALGADGSKSWTLPPKSLETGARRLGNFALLAGIVELVNGVLEQFVLQPGPRRGDEVTLSALAGAMLLSLGMFVASRRRDLDAARFLGSGLVYEVVTAFLIGVSDHAARAAELTVRGWSPIAVWIVVFPLIVPSARGKTVVATIAAALMDPIGLALGVSRGLPTPGPAVLLGRFLPTAVAAIAGIVGARIVHRLSATAGLAREMGSYRLVSPLGHGGMGEVWRAEHRMLARAAAIKLIRTVDGTNLASREVLARFEREARATASLRSPHTIQVYDSGVTEDGSFYYVMELLDGFALDDLVRRFGALPEERVVYLLRQVCHSLEEAHRAGLVHRDVKPGNIFVCRYGLDVDFVKVLDFGLVKPVLADATSDLTAEGFVTGTPSYMSPEIALGYRELDGRSDLYALGCVGYYLLTGSAPFPARNRSAMEVLIDHAQKLPLRPSQHAGRAFDRGLEDLLMTCLAKAPTDRPRSAHELDARLAALELRRQWTPERARLWWGEAAAVVPPGAGTDVAKPAEGRVLRGGMSWMR